MIHQERPSFIFLYETLDNKGRMEKLRRELKFEGLLSVNAVGKSGGLALMWKYKDQV